MAEYIEREAVLKIIDDNCPHDKGGYNTEEEMGAGVACYYIRKAVNDIPTADVAPRAEVARVIFEEIEEYAELQIESLNIVEKVDLSGAAFFGGGKQAFVLLLDRLAELKKKYTEETK